VIPANPYLGRTIRDGNYYFNSELIHLSSFSNDPEFPITSSAVTGMLRAKNNDIHVIKQHEALPSFGIIVGEVQENADLPIWAGRIEKNMVLAGAVCFFAAVLHKMQVQGKGLKVVNSKELRHLMLFVCGTTFNKSRTAIRGVKANGGPVSYMPEKIITSSELSETDFEAWSNQVVELLSANGKAIIAIEESTASTQANANDLREKTAYAVNKIFQKMHIRELVVEGGSTAASIIRRQNFTKLFPVSELSPGVIRMSVEGTEDLFMTIKPGSYEWSPELWKF
jgi:uncharacterized protein YgbK (DUF1537 family)